MRRSIGKWQQLSSKVVFENPFYVVQQDEVIRPDGSKGIYNVVEDHGAVIIVAVDEKHSVALIGCHRYPNGTYSIEVPAGGIEDDEDPLDSAKRELREEAGIIASNWKHIGTTFPAKSMLRSKNYIFLATDLSKVESEHDGEEGITETFSVPFGEVLEMIKNGKITDGCTISSLMLAGLELGALK